MADGEMEGQKTEEGWTNNNMACQARKQGEGVG